jgi:hypothetical protein
MRGNCEDSENLKLLKHALGVVFIVDEKIKDEMLNYKCTIKK